MRCLACGGEMILLEATPDSTMPGYEYQTFQCSACGDSERRLNFNPVQSSLRTLSSQDNDLTAPGVWERMIERVRKEQMIRHCLACGEEMALVEAVPDNNMGVVGYEHQTLQCSGCGESERRLIFNSRQSTPGISHNP
jgi:hypothetical protein